MNLKVSHHISQCSKHVHKHDKFRIIPIYKINKSANALALCHPPSASLCSVLAGQYSSPIFAPDKYNILNDILTEFEFRHY